VRLRATKKRKISSTSKQNRRPPSEGHEKTEKNPF
jgi:hypothetical protein